MLSLTWAVAAHASLAAFALLLPAHAIGALPPVVAEVEVTLGAEWPEQTAPQAPGQTPGGGSPEPDPAGPAISTPKNEGPKQPAPIALRDETVRPAGPVTRAPELPEEVPEGPDASEAELATALDPLIQVSYPEPVRPRAARQMAVARRQRAPATAPVIAGSDERAGRSYGYGAGANGGPGGPGAGWGSGKGGGDASFGGKRGHFTGQVCALEPGTTSLRRVGQCPIITTIYTDHFNVTPRKFVRGFPGVERNEWFLIEYKGAFEAKVDGEYLFRIVSDDGSMLFIDEERVVSHDGVHSPTPKLGSTHLTAGQHQLRLLYFQGPRFDIALQLFVTPPGDFEKLFGPRI